MEQQSSSLPTYDGELSLLNKNAEKWVGRVKEYNVTVNYYLNRFRDIPQKRVGGITSFRHVVNDKIIYTQNMLKQIQESKQNILHLLDMSEQELNQGLHTLQDFHTELSQTITDITYKHDGSVPVVQHQHLVSIGFSPPSTPVLRRSLRLKRNKRTTH